MPEMDGMEATRIIKQEMKLNVNIVMDSATTDEGMVAEARSVGCDDFLPKPISMNELYKVMVRFCGRATATVIRAEPVEPADEPVEVTPVRVAIDLPEAFIQQLKEAVDVGDVTGLRELLGQLRRRYPQQSALSDEAERLLREFDFERLAQLFEGLDEGVSLHDA